LVIAAKGKSSEARLGCAWILGFFRAVGYRESDIPERVAGTLKQQRLLATSPKPVTDDDLAEIFAHSMELW
jgi:hypothetical protein